MSGKRLLKSMLAQTGSLNRMQEQREMWRLRELEKSAHWGDFRVREPRAMIARGRLLSDTLPSSPPPTSHRSHRRQTSPEDHAHHEPREVRDSAEGYWTRRLLKQEENDPGRWGHSGYRELYAEDFASSEDNDSEEEEEVRRPKPRGSENGSSSVKKKRKKEVSSVGSSKRKRRRGLSESTEDEEERKSRKKKRKLKVDKRGVKRKDGRKKSKHKHSQS